MSVGSSRKTFYIAVIPLLVMLIPIVYSVVSFAAKAAGGGPEPLLEISTEYGDSCVRETEYMRFHHWELLLEVREQVVRDGHREGPLLGDCRRCHENRAGFCDRCHKIANVMLDCFHCHYYPETPGGSHSGGHAAAPQQSGGEDMVGRGGTTGGEVTDG